MAPASGAAVARNHGAFIVTDAASALSIAFTGPKPLPPSSEIRLGEDGEGPTASGRRLYFLQLFEPGLAGQVYRMRATAIQGTVSETAEVMWKTEAGVDERAPSWAGFVSAEAVHHREVAPCRGLVGDYLTLRWAPVDEPGALVVHALGDDGTIAATASAARPVAPSDSDEQRRLEVLLIGRSGEDLFDSKWCFVGRVFDAAGQGAFTSRCCIDATSKAGVCEPWGGGGGGTGTGGTGGTGGAPSDGGHDPMADGAAGQGGQTDGGAGTSGRGGLAEARGCDCAVGADAGRDGARGLVGWLAPIAGVAFLLAARRRRRRRSV